METKDLNTKLSQIISSSEEEIVQAQEPEVIIKVKDGLFEHTEIVNKKYVTSDGRQLLKEVRFEN